MIPSDEQIRALHERYAPNAAAFERVYVHCKIVTEIALALAEKIADPIDIEIVRASCLLHDIGTYICFDDQGNGNYNKHDYKLHAIFGAAIVTEEGYDPRIAEAIRTHVLMGLTKEEIVEHKIALPHNNYEPTTIEGRLLCYADRFHSKGPAFNAYDSFVTSLNANLPKQAKKLAAAANEFGLPDVPALAVKYGHPIR